MQLVIDIKSDLEVLKKMRLPWWALLCMMIGGGLGSWFFDSIGRDSMALPTMNCIMVFSFLVVLKWRLRRHMWFWAILTIAAALNVLMILFVPWTENWVPALAIAVIDTADLIVILAIISVAGRLMGGTKTAEG
jgi:hypothetical protein